MSLPQAPPPGKPERIQIVIKGRVQGVGFRYAIQRKAAELGLKGWVRNTSEGAVEAEAHGPADRLEKFLEWCHRGPASARVEVVEIKVREPIEVVAEKFEIRRD